MPFPIHYREERVQVITGDAQKREAGVHAATFLRDGMRVGLGTGSTVRHLLEEIAARRRRGELGDLIGVPTSEDTARRAAALGIPLATLAELPHLDLTIDGADEVDPNLDLIKGLGAALLREKIVAAASDRLVVIVDESKLVERLGTRAPLPVEVDPFGEPVQYAYLRSLGCEPVLRLGSDGEPLVTDGGHHILDCRFPGGIEDARALELAIRSRPGVLETGLFIGMADHVVVAAAGGVRVLSRAAKGSAG